MRVVLESVRDKIVVEPDTASDLLSAVLGERLGSGYGRTVYRSLLQSGQVLKLANGNLGVGNGVWQNTIEYQIWFSASEQLKECLAPVNWQSESGLVLSMQEVSPLVAGHKYVARLPVFDDMHPSNLGILDGRVVLCDYGLAAFMMGDLLYRDVEFSFNDSERHEDIMTLPSTVKWDVPVTPKETP